MSHILVVKSSILAKYSHSNQLIDDLVDQWLSKNPHDTFRVRDLSQSVPPMLDNQLVGFLNPANRDQLTRAQQQASALSDELIDEIKQADQIILGVPTYNFTIPAQLKNYIDFIARSGVTFTYTEQGPQGLLTDKPVLVIATRGGIYADTPNDFVTPYLRCLFAFIGITNLHFIYAEGLNLGEEAAANALEQAKQQISQWIK